jgi:transposase
MELLSVIRRWHYRDHFSIREISRRTALSRNTVRKYLRSDSVEPKFSIPDRPSKLDPHADKLSHMLRQEAGKSRKQKRTIKQLHADLVVLGYEGSYNRVAAFARDWRAARQREQKTAGRGVFVPLAFMAGEAFQFDWSEDWAVIAGERTKLQVAHFKLSYSRAFILRAYPQQTHEMLFDAHNHAFRMLGGVPRRGIYDNMRTAVDKIGRGQESPGQRAVRSHGQPLPVRGGVLQSGFRLGEGADREKRPGHAPSALATHAALPLSRRAERLAGDAMPRALGIDAARLTSWHGRRCLGGRSAALDAAFEDVRRLRRIRQARIADVPSPSGPQSLQRASLLRQSSG